MSSLRGISLEHYNLTTESTDMNMKHHLENLVKSFNGQVDGKEKLDSDINSFMSIFKRYLETKGQTIDWNKIKSPGKGMIVPFEDLTHSINQEKLASKLCVLKLNGGLGTTMGCVGPKSAIEVRDGSSFLDLTVKQIKFLNKELGSDVPLILMNSFNTHDDTMAILKKYSHSRVKIETFNQSKHPRILRDSLTPMPRDSKTTSIDEWYPPGHGDVFQSLYSSGLLDKLISQGKEYLFISNIDNLAATVNFDILQHMVDTKSDFIMEVTEKTGADVKGGTLIEYEGKMKLLEIAQVPSDKVEEFKSIKRFKIFNTNNLWISLPAIKTVLEKNMLKDIDIIENKKHVKGKDIIQLEIAAGAAIQFFKNAHGVKVPRERFLPVKSTSDLLLIQSDLYNLFNGTLTLNPNRIFPSVPVIKLGAEFKDVPSYLGRFSGIPNILELDQLTIAGDVKFGSNVVLKGTVIIVANHGSRIDIPSGSILENKVVTGALHILEH